jgi:dihydroneopterin aldolase
MDKVRILNLKIPARHGVYEFEKDKDGLFELDVEMHTDLSSAGKSDELKDTINYDKVVSVIIEEFTKKDYHLIEAVGQTICKKLLADFNIQKVVIKIRKPHAPIMANLDTVEVELVREK